MCCASGSELQPETQRQLVLLDLSVPVDVTVAEQGLFELVQVCAAQVGLRDGREGIKKKKTVSTILFKNTQEENEHSVFSQRRQLHTIVL